MPEAEVLIRKVDTVKQTLTRLVLKTRNDGKITFEWHADGTISGSY